MSIRITHLKRFLPGLDGILDDLSVTELMVNGPENVWVERSGAGLEPFPAPALTADVLRRAAIQIARPLGLDPESKPTLDARLDDGSRVAICVPPASPSVAITIRRFGERSFTVEDLVQAGSLPRSVLDAARRTLAGRRNILVAGGTGSGKTTMLNALIELLDPAERIVSIEDTLELRIHQPNAVRFEARELGKSATTVRDLVKHSLRHRPDHIVVGEIRGAEAADLLQALNTGHGGSLTTIHANNATSALDRLASCAMQARDLPWDAICRNIVNGISLVLHMSRIAGRRAIEEARYLTGWESDDNTWLTSPAYLRADPAAPPAPVP
ncbi:MAG: ATPase, T2SS/T4P/T4SS family [Acidobacteriota bacterium]|nr:ATPase, T2SS/T4P/T4SS family [Acidobacteriota bacterium]